MRNFTSRRWRRTFALAADVHLYFRFSASEAHDAHAARDESLAQFAAQPSCAARDENRLGFNAMEVPSIELRARDFDVKRVLFGVVPRKFSDRGFLARGKLLFHGVRHLCRTVVNAQAETQVQRSMGYAGRTHGFLRR